MSKASLGVVYGGWRYLVQSAEGEAWTHPSSHAKKTLRLPCLNGHHRKHCRLCGGFVQENGATTLDCQSPDTWLQRCCLAPTAADGRRRTSTDALWQAARSWSGPSARGFWAAALRAAGRRDGHLHGRGPAAHLTSPMRGEMGVSGLARAVTWSRHWSSRGKARSGVRG